MVFVRTPIQLYILRVLLGLAEAGFFLGIIYCLSLRFLSCTRCCDGAVHDRRDSGERIGGLGTGVDGRLRLRGWQWLFLIEGIPSIVLGAGALLTLRDRPRTRSGSRTSSATG